MPPTSELLLSCNCGTVEVQVRGSPAACAYCHCSSCRDFYGLPVLAATAWKSGVVQTVKGHAQMGKYRHPTKQMQRHFCLQCGEIMFGVNRLGLTVIRNSLMTRALGGTLPVELRPSFHLFYAEREIDIDDELPKYMGSRLQPPSTAHVKGQASGGKD
jgi:hypothetical protein